ncbi:cGMP-specific 3',5'-cyclic phosphodiesterase-like isoform X2 [Dysidea avara]
MAARELSSNDVTAWLDAHPHFCMRYYSKKYGNTPLLGADPFADPRKDISRRKSVPSRKSSHELRRMDRNELIMELVRDIADELDVNSLSHKILINVNILLNADRSSLFLREGQGDNCYLVSRLFDVREGSSVAESVHDESDAIRIKCGVGIVGYAAETRETVNIADAYEDERFNKQVDKMTGYVTKSILCTPLSNSDGQVIGVAQVINKSGGSEIFTPSDVKIFRTYMTFCAIGLTNAKLYEQSLMESKRSRLLLSLAKKLFEDQTSLDRMVTQVMLQATELVKCERCTVLLLDTNKEHITFSNVFTGGGDIKCGRSSEQVTPACDEVVKGVAQTGKPCRLQDDQQLLEGNIKSLLCMPIYNGDDIIGVAQLINKLNGLPFDENDERYFEMFAIFCGLGIHNVINYEQKCKALARYSVALEQMSYHTTASSEDSAYLATAVVPVAKEMDLYSFQFNDTSLSDDKTLLACISMFSELNLIQSFNIDYKVLCNWLYTVRRNYRAVKYHNWRHAFSVSQTMFAMITSGNLGNVLSPLETLSLIVACLCHDIDHRGTNNAFQAKSCSPLATLYSTSIMERHHFAHSIMILNSKGNNIFSGLEEQDYKLVVNMLEKAILATDLAVYFQKKDQFTQLGKRDTSEWSKDCHHELLRAMMMTACDLAAITKPWEIQQKVAECVADEFFEQGDKERNELHLEPMAMMDRKKKSDLPKMQVDFIDSICLPVYSTFANMTESLQPLLQGIQDNRRNWVEQKQLCVNGH